MSAPRYRPRDFCAEPAGFGKVLNVRWVRPNERTPEALIRAARLQHLYAVRIRLQAGEIAKERKWKEKNQPAADDGKPTLAPLRELAWQMGCSYARLMRCLRGEVVMRLDDIAWADVVIGGISEIDRKQPPVQAANGDNPQRGS